MFITHVTFRGRPFLFVPFDGREWGTIATELQFRTGRRGYAFLMPTGEVMRDCEVIGTREDVRFGDTVLWPAYKMPPCLN